MKLISKLLLLVITTVGIFSVSVSGLIYFVTYDGMIKSHTSEAITLTESVAAELANPIYFLDIGQIDSITKKLYANPSVVHVSVYDDQGRLLSEDASAHHNTINKNDEFFSKSLSSQKTIFVLDQNIIRISSPIMISEKIGSIQLDYSLEKLNNVLRDTLTMIVTFTIIFFMIGIGIGYFISKSITTPLENLKKATSEIAKGNKSIKIVPNGATEIQELAKNIQFMADELADSQKILIRSERLSAIGQLASRLAHDIRNPLSTIKNSIELIHIGKYDQANEKLKLHLDRLERAANRISHQINDVMDFVKLKPLELGEIDLNDVILHVLEDLKISKIRIDLQTNESVLNLNADSKKLEVLFTNLLLNAQQAIENNGVVIIRTKKNADSAEIEIEDTANALNVDDVPKLFEPLYTTKQNGTGLGLVSCKNIVESHGGKINVSVKPTIFHIVLPLNLKSKIPVET
jgi:signal transduction histidine kinase